MRFGTDGIRGRWPAEPLTPAVAEALATAVAARFGPRLAVVRDTRATGPAVLAAVCRGRGVAVQDLGVLPTPAVSVFVAQGRADAGLAITASHNPWHDNGLKVVGPGGTKLSPQDEAALDTALSAALGTVGGPASAAVDRHAEGLEAYVAAVLAALPGGTWLSGVRVAVDCAHGAAWQTAPRILAELGAEVVALGVAPDGRNINVDRGAVHPQALAAAVRDQDCAVGLALDGDADRCVLVNAAGRVVDGDAVLLLLAEGPGVVGTILCNEALAVALTAQGRTLVRTPVGDRHVAQALGRLGWTVGGEPSGHVLLSDGLPTGDGLLTGLRVIAGGPDLASRLADWRPHAQASAAVPVTDRPPLETLAPLQAALGALTGRAVVRYSGTEPRLRLQVEAPRADVAERELASLLEAVRASGVGPP